MKSFTALQISVRIIAVTAGEIDIDEGTMDYYRSLGGELGKRLPRISWRCEENTMIMREDGYCPF